VQIEVDAETVRHLQEPVTILAAKHAVGGPGRAAMQAELAQLQSFVASQRQVWQARREMLQAKYAACC